MATLLFFGKLQDVFGARISDFAIPETTKTTFDLRVFLDSKFQTNDTLASSSVRIAINNEMISAPASIKNTDEIAFLPPVGGG